MKCDIGYIYAILYNSRPVYIGQTQTPKKRFRDHKRSIVNNSGKKVHRELHKIQTEQISFKIIMCCPKTDLKLQEVKVMKYCIKKGIKLLNNCVIYNSII